MLNIPWGGIFPRNRWVRVSEFPKANRFGRRSVIIDRCYTMAGEPHSIHVAYVADHPVLREYASIGNVPRAEAAASRYDQERTNRAP